MFKRIYYAIAILIFTGCIATYKNQPVENSKEIIETNINGKGQEIIVEFEKGEHYNHPSMVFWLEDMNENYIQTLFCTKYIAIGYYGYGQISEGKWTDKPGQAIRKATLPYWMHKRGIKENLLEMVPSPKNPVPDAYTGATPLSDYNLVTKTDSVMKGKIRFLLEINQPWDWNEYWTNDKYKDNFDYKTSCQPSVIYSVTIDYDNKTEIEYYLNPIGHGHFSGDNGELYTDLSTLTTALEIIKKVKVKIYYNK